MAAQVHKGLPQRNFGDGSDIGVWLLLSIALHVMMVFTVNITTPEHKAVYIPLYEVDMLPADHSGIQKGIDTPPVSEKKPDIIPPPLKKPMKLEKVKKPETPVSLPSSTKNVGKTEDTISKIRERVEAREAIEKLRQKAGDGGTSSSDGIKISGSAPARVYHFDELDAELRAYFEKISRLINEAWSLPESLRNRGFKTEISIHVRKDGIIDSLWIEKGSGNKFYDESSMRAINKVNPLPPLPSGWKESSIDLGLRF